MLNGEDGDRHRGWKDFNSGCWRQTPTTTKTKQNKTKMGGGGFNSDCWMDTEKTDWRAFNRLKDRQRVLGSLPHWKLGGEETKREW